MLTSTRARYAKNRAVLSRQYYLQAESERQQYEWMVAIANAATASNRRNLGSSTSNLVPQSGPLMRSRSTSGSNSALFPTSASAVPIPPVRTIVAKLAWFTSAI